VEKKLVSQEKIIFYAMLAPKLRRYFTWRYLFFPLEVFISFFQALVVLLKNRPQVIVSAGGFVSVPLVWVGWLLRIPALIHQQDLQPGLANKLMAPLAVKITVAFPESLAYFPKKKTTWIGNPVRDLTPTTDNIALDKSVPTVFIMGGGTGACAINALVTPEICTFCNVIHMTGENRARKLSVIHHPRYHQYAFLQAEMKEALQKAEVVVSRAGLGSISELAALAKPALIIPIPHSHQEKNADFLKTHQAAIILNQEKLTAQIFCQEIKSLLFNLQKKDILAKNISALSQKNATFQFYQKITSFKKI